VTSVLQTTAGKMIFGRLWEDREDANGQSENTFSIHDSRSVGFRRATRDLRQNTIIEEID
jgi:hypothetical protein